MNSAGHPFWQRNYYERIIRTDEELNRIRQYIADNPSNWDRDPEHPDADPRTPFNRCAALDPIDPNP
jgi:hypothetical protein